MARHQLPKEQVLEYALDGAKVWKSLNQGQLDAEELETLEKDIAELERRLKLVRIAAQHKEQTRAHRC